jgi:hypothetical protein
MPLSSIFLIKMEAKMSGQNRGLPLDAWNNR